MVACLASAPLWAAGSNKDEETGARGIYRGVLPVVKFDVSPPLRDIKPVPVPSGPLMMGGSMVDPPSGLEWLITAPGRQGPDLIAQAHVGPLTIPAPSISFNAQPNISGVNPPDPVGDVGPNHYVAMSNLSLQIFLKNGTSVFGPVNTNTLWAGFGGACQTENSGDPIVLHDQLADRWIITQFTSAGPTFFNCVAISTGPDPTGTYFRYAFTTGANFPDYPKYGVWPNAYFISTREFVGAGGPFGGVGAYAINRAQMLAGNPTPQVISFIVPPGAAAFNIGDGLLPADLDGFTPPPPGSPHYFVGSMDSGGPYGAPQDALTLWKFVVDFATPANSSFVLSNTIPVANFDSIFPCSGRQCIPQAGTATLVDILSYRQRPMHRLAYRNFGSHEALVTNQSVEAATGMAGIRWWEIRTPNTTPTIFQEGTYAPGITDGVHRWMGSLAQDSAGNMALGYSASSATIFPSVRYTGRLSTDTPGTMPQGEGEIIAGTGSNTATGNAARWGDYSSMNVDPTDDCTFWYVNQWTPVTSASGWQLRVGSFRFNECGSPTYVMGAGPASQTICAGTTANYSINVGSIAGFNSPVTLSSTGEPAASVASFSPNPVASLPGVSTFSVSTTGVAAGSYPISINGVSAGPINRTAEVGLVVQVAPPAAATLTTPANGATNVAPNVAFTWSAVPNTIDYTVQIATDAAFNTIVRTATVTGTSYTPAALDTSATYFWRVYARNACSVAAELFADGFEGTGPAASLGTVSATGTFVTAAAPGDCPAGAAPTIVLSEDFEGAATGWGPEGGSGNDSWAITSNFPFAGTKALQGLTPETTAVDHRYLSPTVNLPSVGNGLTLSFQSRQQMEPRAGGCWDGGFVEVSTDGGTTYTQITAGLLTDPYQGPLGNGNPAAPKPAWCGDPQAYLKSVIDLAPYAGLNNVRFRFHVTSDTSVRRAEGWNIDNVEIKRCN